MGKPYPRAKYNRYEKPRTVTVGESFIRVTKPLVLKTPEELEREREKAMTDQQRMVRDITRKLEGQLMSLWVMGAEKDANSKQKRELEAHLPRLVRQYRATFNTVPVIRFIHKTMGLDYRPKDPQVRAFIDRLEKELRKAS